MRTITANLHEDRYTFLIISCSVLLRMRKFSYIFIEKYKTHNLFQEILSGICAVYETKYKTIIWLNRPQIIQEPMAVSCLPKKGCNHTYTICNNYLFPTATTVGRTPLINTVLMPSFQQKSSGLKVPNRKSRDVQLTS